MESLYPKLPIDHFFSSSVKSFENALSVTNFLQTSNFASGISVLIHFIQTKWQVFMLENFAVCSILKFHPICCCINVLLIFLPVIEGKVCVTDTFYLVCAFHMVAMLGNVHFAQEGMEIGCMPAKGERKGPADSTYPTLHNFVINYIMLCSIFQG